MKTTNQKSFALFADSKIDPTAQKMILGGTGGGEENPEDIVIEEDVNN